MHDEIDDDDICENDETDETDDEVLESVAVIITIVDEDDLRVHDNDSHDEIHIIEVLVVLLSTEQHDEDDDDIHQLESDIKNDQQIDDVDLLLIYLDSLVHIDDDEEEVPILEHHEHEHDDADDDELEQIQNVDEMLRIIDDEVVEIDITDDAYDIDVNE